MKSRGGATVIEVQNEACLLQMLGPSMDFYETENTLMTFLFGAIGTAAALWLLWVAFLEMPSALRDFLI